MTTVRQASIDLFRTHGLTTWFGNPGSSELTLLEGFPADFRYVLGLQEMIPVGMADGYAQITRRPALVSLHTAPGVGNAMGALYNAWMNKTPLIVTAGNQRRTMQNQGCLLTNTDAVLVPRPFVKWSAEPAIASEVPAVLAHAIHIAQTPPMGPVFVSLPMDDMRFELDPSQLADIAVVRDRKVHHGGALSDQLARDIAERLNSAKSPALIVGGDVERSGAYSALVTLAERVQAPVWSAPFPGLSGFPENHPLYRGMLPAGAGWISKILTGHDLVLVFGAPVFRYYPQIPGPYLPKGAQLIHFTSDPDEAARAPVGDAVVTDVRAAAEALIGYVNQTVRSAPAMPAKTQTDASPAKTPLSPEKLWTTLDRVAPENALWVSEAGGSEPIIASCIKARGPFSHLSAAGGGLGFGLPAAVGAQLAAPDRPVVALMGDGSIQYAVTALWSAACYKIPLIIIVASNAEYGVLKQFAGIEKISGVPGLDLPALDIVSCAAGYGVSAHEAHSTDELVELFRGGIANRAGPLLINVAIARVS